MGKFLGCSFWHFFETEFKEAQCLYLGCDHHFDRKSIVKHSRRLQSWSNLQYEWDWIIYANLTKKYTQSEKNTKKLVFYQNLLM